MSFDIGAQSSRLEQFREMVNSGWLLGILSVFGGLLVWQAIGTGVISTSVAIAPPTDVAVEWYTLVTTGTLVSAWFSSLQAMFLGFFIATGTAIPLGFLMARSQIVEWALNPFVDALYATPPIAYIPLIIVWFGLHFDGRVFIVFASCFFEMLINTHQGIGSINEDYLDVGRSFGASWWEQQRNVLFPATLPHIFAGLRLGAGRAVRGMIIAELFLALVNLGALLEEAGRTYQTDVQLAVIITITATGVIFQQLVVRAEHWAIPWHFAGEGGT